MDRPLKTMPRRLNLSGLDLDEFQSRVAEILTVKRARFPSVYADGAAARGAKEGIESRVAAEMREEDAADRA